MAGGFRIRLAARFQHRRRHKWRLGHSVNEPVPPYDHNGAALSISTSAARFGGTGGVWVSCLLTTDFQRADDAVW
jgi:hypothetical protein